MKHSDKDKILEELLRSSTLAAGGFMGSDIRNVFEIIDADAIVLARMGVTREMLAERMDAITKLAIAGLGIWIRIDDRLEARTDEARGLLVCPWPHSGTYAKRITTVRKTGTSKTVQWSDLNLHLIKEHGFFEGKGASFRIEPGELVEIIF